MVQIANARRPRRPARITTTYRNVKGRATTDHKNFLLGAILYSTSMLWTHHTVSGFVIVLLLVSTLTTLTLLDSIPQRHASIDQSSEVNTPSENTAKMKEFQTVVELEKFQMKNLRGHTSTRWELHGAFGRILSFSELADDTVRDTKEEHHSLRAPEPEPSKTPVRLFVFHTVTIVDVQGSARNSDTVGNDVATWATDFTKSNSLLSSAVGRLGWWSLTHQQVYCRVQQHLNGPLKKYIVVSSWGAHMTIAGIR